jgi:hypothetical protein
MGFLYGWVFFNAETCAILSPPELTDTEKSVKTLDTHQPLIGRNNLRNGPHPLAIHMYDASATELGIEDAYPKPQNAGSYKAWLQRIFVL